MICDFLILQCITGEVRASSYDPGNRAGSVTGINFVVCSYGKFQPGYRMKFKKQNQNGATLTSIVRDYHSFADSCNFTNKANSNTFEVEMHTRQNYAILAAQFRKRS